MFSKSGPESCGLWTFGKRRLYAKIFCLGFIKIKIYKFEDDGYKYENNFLKFYPQNTQVRHFWCQFQSLLFLDKTLQFNKFSCTELKYDSRF